MNKIYDVVLNFNSRLFDIYEWEMADNILHIRRIPLFKVKSSLLHDFVDKKIELDSIFLNSIYKKTEYYHKNKTYPMDYAFVLTDGKVAIAFESDGRYITKYSKLIYDEEEDIIDYSRNLFLNNIRYTVIASLSHDFETRNEGVIKKYIYDEINYYAEHNTDILKYICMEYFETYKDNIFINLEKYWDDVYVDIYNFLKKLPLRH